MKGLRLAALSFESSTSLLSDTIQSASVEVPGVEFYRKKLLAVVFGGALITFQVSEPCRTILKTGEFIVGVSDPEATRSNHLYRFPSRSTGNRDLWDQVSTKRPNTLVALTSSGLETLVSHTDAQTSTTQGKKNSIADFDGAAGYPTCLCIHSDNESGCDAWMIFVGFSSGTVIRFILPDTPDASSKLSPASTTLKPKEMTSHEQLMLPTRSVHESPLRKLVVTPLPTTRTGHPTSSVLIIADENGLLSSWSVGQIIEHTTQLSLAQQAENDGYSRMSPLWAAHAHSGPIIFMSAVIVESFPGKVVVVTATPGGLVKSWLLHPNGKLMLSSYFSVSSSISTMDLIVLQPSIALQGARSIPRIHSDNYSNVEANDTNKCDLATEASIICICGDSAGFVESWLLSSDSFKAGRKPARSMHVSSSPISLISALNYHDASYFGLQKSMDGDRPITPVATAIPYYVVCGNTDGEFLVLDMDSTAFFQVGNAYFWLPISPRSIVKFEDSFGIVGEREIIQMMKLTASPELPEEAVLGKTATHSGLLDTSQSESISSSHWDGNESVGTFPDNISGGVSASVVSPTRGVESPQSPTVKFLSRSRYMRRQLILGMLEKARPGFQTAIRQVKKDGNFLQLFKQAVPDQNGFISVEAAVSILYRWMGFDEDDKSSQLPLVDVIRDPIFCNGISFDEMVVVAAFALESFRSQYDQTSGKSSRSRRTLSYSGMRALKREVTFNVMGERCLGPSSEQKSPGYTPLPMGDPSGKQISYALVAPKVERPLMRTKSVSQTPVHVLLRKIPECLASKIGRNVQIPNIWAPSCTYWLDIRRTVLVVRTIFDLCNKALGMYTGELRGLTILSDTIVKYFNEKHGAVNLNVAKDRIVYFLEALLQYSHVPVVLTMKRFLFDSTEVSSRDNDVDGLLMYLQLRALLYSRKFVTRGNLVPPALFREGDDVECDGDLTNSDQQDLLDDSDVIGDNESRIHIDSLEGMASARGAAVLKVHWHLITRLETMNGAILYEQYLHDAN
jgi:hypothetical protein